MFVDGGERLTATMLLQHATICDKTLQQLKTLIELVVPLLIYNNNTQKRDFGIKLSTSGPLHNL